jgi:hypothetical protein
MTNTKARIPEAIWKKLGKQSKSGAFAIRMIDGLVLKPICVDSNGIIKGRIVGGHDGVTEMMEQILEEHIEAVRVADGLVGCLGITRWVKRT